MKRIFLLITVAFTLFNCTSSEKIAKNSYGFYDINNKQLENLLKNKTTLVDIRLEEEWEETGIIPNSKTITLFTANGGVSRNFLPELQKLGDKNTPIILICRTGSRTNSASSTLVKELGYTNIYNVKNGIKGWIAENREVVKY